MDLRQTITDIRNKIKADSFHNEASITQGIVMRILTSLGWPSYDTQLVYPEYSLAGTRVDLALCHPKNKPLVFVEVKQPGNSKGADRQLFEYAFHTGVPMAILTDGQEWHFYLPAEQGAYQERRVYNLDILERDLSEIILRFERYLSYDNIRVGTAIDSARKDYRDVSKEREIRQTLPKAWKRLIEERDELLVELIIDKVESLCGYKPKSTQVEQFLHRFEPAPSGVISTKKQSTRKSVATSNRRNSQNGTFKRYGYYLNGEFYPTRNGIDTLIQVFEKFTELDNTFPKRFAGLSKHGSKRRYLAEDKYELYPGRPDFAETKAHQLSCGWWVGKNYSKRDIKKIIGKAAEVMSLNLGNDIKVHLKE